jgi:uncharacterized protein (DUF169 family)
MPKFGRDVKKIVETLGLKWKPIAGKFSNRPVKGTDADRKVRICEAFNIVRRENVTITISNKNCTCSGGLHFTGLKILPMEAIATVLTGKGHRAYESLDVALASLRKQPQPVKRGEYFTLGPLDKFEDDPDLVFLFVNPAQADRILGLTSFTGADPFAYYAVSSLCSTITNALAKGKPEINFISVFERRNGKWSPNELIVALPFKDFEIAVKSIPYSGFGRGTKP